MAEWYEDAWSAVTDLTSHTWSAATQASSDAWSAATQASTDAYTQAQAQWDAVWAQADDAWKALYARSQELWTTIEQAPARYSETVSRFLRALDEARDHLAHIESLLPTESTPEAAAVWASYTGLQERWDVLAAPFYRDAVPAEHAQQAPVGALPLLAVGGLLVGVAAIGWAWVGHEYAANLRDQTALADKELTARVEASKEGRALQPSTLPPPPDPGDELAGVGKYVAAGAAVLVALALVPSLIKR